MSTDPVYIFKLANLLSIFEDDIAMLDAELIKDAVTFAKVEFLVSTLPVYKSNEIPDDDKIPLPGTDILSIDAETAYKFFHFLSEAPKSNALLLFGIIDELKSASREIENQVKAQQVLTKEGYNSLEIQKILENKTLTAAIAANNQLNASVQERKQLNAEIQKTINLNQKLSMIKLTNNITDLNVQIEAYKRLSDAGVKQEVINEILKDKANSWAIANSPGVVADQFGSLIGETKKYIDLISYIEKQTKSFEQTTQDAIDANTASLDLQARQIQNQFDISNFKLKADIKLAEDAGLI